MAIIQHVATIATSFLTWGGYPGFLLLATLDSTLLPLPNETFMPFVGGLIAQGVFSWHMVLIISSIGAVCGSLTSYAIGYYGTELFVKKYGTYLRISMHDVEKTHIFFTKYGDVTILIARFIPVVRQFSSLPAGAAKMNIWKFCLFTLIGSLAWNSAILLIGYQFAGQLSHISPYLQYTDPIILFGLVGIGILWYIRRPKNIT